MTSNEAGHYIVNAHRPGAVTIATKASFLSPTSTDLILVKSNHIEVRQYQNQSSTNDSFLPLALDIPINGRIISLLPIKHELFSTDLLFIITSTYDYAVLSYNPTNKESSHGTTGLAKGNIRDPIGRECECGILVSYSENKCIAIHLYDGFVKILPMYTGKRKSNLFGDAYNVRLEERTVLSMQFLPCSYEEEEDCKMPAKGKEVKPNTDNPNLVLLHQDSRGLQHVTSHTIDLKSKEMLRYSETNKLLKKSRVDGGSGLLLPLGPSEIVIVGQYTITYYRNNPNIRLVLSISPPTIVSSCVVLSDNSILLGDEHGYLFLMTLLHDNGLVSSLKLECLGITSISSTIVPIANLVYIGSTFGNSQLISINNNNTMEILEEYPNLGPIVDFDIIQRSACSPSQIVTCSGAAKDATIRLITNGIGMEDIASVDLSGITGMWNIRSKFFDEHDSFLVQSYMNETRILGYDGGEMEEVVMMGLDAYSSSLFLSNVYPSDGIVQITPKEIRLLSAEKYCVLDVWSGGLITVANGNEAGQIVISLRGGIIVYLQIQGNKICECGRRVMEKEVSCISLHPFDIEWESPCPSFLVAIGLWENFSVRLLSLSYNLLEEKLSIDLGGDTQARSIVLCTLGQSSQKNHMVLIGLGDGHLLSFSLSLVFHEKVLQNVSVYSKKKVMLGSQALSFRIFRTTTKESINTCVFATGDRPTVIYTTNNSKLSFANVNLSYNSQMIVNYVTPFSLRQSTESEYCLCFADESTLRIGIIDDIQKLHVQSFHIPGESPRRIAYHDSSRSFIIGSIATTSTLQPLEVDGLVSAFNMPNSILCLDDIHMEVMDRFELDPNEIVLAVICTSLKPKVAPYIIIGTAYTFPDEDEPTSGRIILLKCEISDSEEDMDTDTPSRKLTQVTEHTTRGGVYSICPFVDGSILASINSKTKLFRLVDSDDGLELQPEPGASHHGHILSQFVKSKLENEDPIAIVGDLMRSISVLQYSPQHKTLEEIARDYNANWTTAIDMISNEYYIGCENWNNLFVLKRCLNMNVPEEVRCRLVTTGEFHLGEMVNKFCSGALAMPVDSAKNSTNSTAISPITIGSQTLFGTVDGSIGIILGLDASTFQFFKALEKAMAQLPSVGGLRHSDYRSFRSDRRVHPCRGFIDGDLVESFLDLSEEEMKMVVKFMNDDGSLFCDGGKEEDGKEGDVLMRIDGEVESSTVNVEKMLSLETVLNRVEEMSRSH